MIDIKALIKKTLQSILLPYSGLLQATGTATVNSARAYDLATINLAPNTLYLILGSVQSSTGYSNSQLCQLTATGARASYGASASRAPGNNGGGVKNWRVIETGTGSATATVTCYGYYTTSHTETGIIIAIPLCQVGGGTP